MIEFQFVIYCELNLFLNIYTSCYPSNQSVLYFFFMYFFKSKIQIFLTPPPLEIYGRVRKNKNQLNNLNVNYHEYPPYGQGTYEHLIDNPMKNDNRYCGEMLTENWIGILDYNKMLDGMMFSLYKNGYPCLGSYYKKNQFVVLASTEYMDIFKINNKEYHDTGGGIYETQTGKELVC